MFENLKIEQEKNFNMFQHFLKVILSNTICFFLCIDLKSL